VHAALMAVEILLKTEASRAEGESAPEGFRVTFRVFPVCLESVSFPEDL
jgi:hypothetical protein